MFKNLVQATALPHASIASSRTANYSTNFLANYPANYPANYAANCRSGNFTIPLN
jgi:hypothetical protein